MCARILAYRHFHKQKRLGYIELYKLAFVYCFTKIVFAGKLVHF